MSVETIEKLITNAIHTAFVRYPEGDGGPHLDYEWIAAEQSAHITRAMDTLHSKLNRPVRGMEPWTIRSLGYSLSDMG